MASCQPGPADPVPLDKDPLASAWLCPGAWTLTPEPFQGNKGRHRHKTKG